MSYYIECLKKYATFSGRARRKEYWMFVLFSAIFCICFNIIDALLATSGMISALYQLAVFIPGIAACCRRLHDINKSGWWLLICLIPLIGAILILIDLCHNSSPGENKYGPNPKGL